MKPGTWALKPRMHQLGLLVNIALALGYALLGGLVARRLRLPTIVGYLLAGVALGPFTPGLTGDVRPSSNWPNWASSFSCSASGCISHCRISGRSAISPFPAPFSRWRSRRRLGTGWRSDGDGRRTPRWYWASRFRWPAPWCCCAGLMDIGALDTPHGRVAVGWLVLEDLATVAILVLLPAAGLAPVRRPTGTRRSGYRQGAALRRADALRRQPDHSR